MTCGNLTLESLDNYAKLIQNQQQRHQDRISWWIYDVSLFEQDNKHVYSTTIILLSKYFLDRNKTNVIVTHARTHWFVQSQKWKHQSNMWNLLLVADVIDLILVSLLLTCNRFYTLFCCFHCWLWTSKCQLGCMVITSNAMVMVMVMVMVYANGYYFSIFW